jgi:hypothetical protein
MQTIDHTPSEIAINRCHPGGLETGNSRTVIQKRIKTNLLYWGMDEVSR